MSGMIGNTGSRGRQVTHFPEPKYNLPLPSHAWRKEVEARLEFLVRLEKGWDGYRAGPVSFEIAYFAGSILPVVCGPGCPAPDVFPGTGGEIQLEWHYGNSHIELFIRKPYDVVATRQIDGEDEVEEVQLTGNFSVAAKWLREMLGDGRAAAATAA